MKFCSITSGSSGNCSFVSSKYSKVLVDAGLSGKKITDGIKSINEDPNQIDAILITHEHTDHIQAAGIISRRFDIPIYATLLTWKHMTSKIGNIKEHNKKLIEKNEIFSINDINIKAFSIPHDAVDPVGFSLSDEKNKITICTDFGYASDEICENAKGSNLLLIESNHDINMLETGPYPYHLKRRILSNTGHISNLNSANFLSEILDSKLKHIVLGHLSSDNNKPELAHKTVNDILVKEHKNVCNQITLDVALKERISSCIELF